MSGPIAEQFDEIAKLRTYIRKREDANSKRLCFITLNLSSGECWCMRAGPNGSHLPCPKAGESGYGNAA